MLSIGALSSSSQFSWLKELNPKGILSPVRGGVYTYVARGGTIACFLHPEHSVVVDTQFPEQAEELRNRIVETTDKPLALLVNTHHHGDHTGGNSVFNQIAKTHLAHENAKVNMSNRQAKSDEPESIVLPTTTFSDRWTQAVGPEQVSLSYLGAAHTNGDALVHFEKANVVHMGDLVFNKRYPYIDKSAGADIKNWIRVLKRARRLYERDTIYLFGHAGEGYPISGDSQALLDMVDVLEYLLSYVRKCRRQGLSLEQILERTTEIPGLPPFKSRGLDWGLKAAWEELENA